MTNSLISGYSSFSWKKSQQIPRYFEDFVQLGTTSPGYSRCVIDDASGHQQHERPIDCHR